MHISSHISKGKWPKALKVFVFKVLNKLTLNYATIYQKHSFKKLHTQRRGHLSAPGYFFSSVVQGLNGGNETVFVSNM